MTLLKIASERTDWHFRHHSVENSNIPPHVRFYVKSILKYWLWHERSVLKNSNYFSDGKKVSTISQLIVQIITIISTYDNVQKSKNTKLGKISIILHFPYYAAKQNAP